MNFHNKLYYDKSKNIISDYEYDLKIKELIDLENSNPEFRSLDSPSVKVGGKITKSFETFNHTQPMLSLSNTYSDQDLTDFDKRVKKILKVEEVDYLCELKYDGVALSISYENGLFKRALTRGDGSKGDDISNNAMTIKTLPLKLSNEVSLEVRGEGFISKSNFIKLNKDKKDKREEVFSNPRNTASGSLKMQDSSVVSKRKINCFMYSLVSVDENILTQEDSLKYLRDLGFNVPDTFKRCSNIKEVKDYINHWEEKRDSLDVETDGIVIKVNNLDYQKILSNTAKSPRWAIAYKYKTESKKTKVIDIQFQVGRTGAITPVALLEPVELSGSIVKRASLHNSNEIDRLDIRINDKVFIEKGGEIIPKITRVDFNERGLKSQEFIFIKRCPSCNTELKSVENQAIHYCPNYKKCPPQVSGRIEHFISKNAMDIEHVGPETIKGLINQKLLNDISDLYKLTYDEIIGLELKIDGENKVRSLKHKSCQNIISSIHKSKNNNFSNVLFGLGIRYVGKTTAEKLAKYFKNIENIKCASFEELIHVEEIGDKIAESLVKYFSDQENLMILDNLEKSGLKLDYKEKNLVKSDKLSGKKFVISGTFENFSRDEIKIEIEKNGGKVSKSLSSKTSFLIAGDNMGPKKKIKAEDLQIMIINENQFIKLIENEIHIKESK
ncbi:MAG: DNA ligase (NAD(+)) LigA [Rhodothermaeota bacterium MED-G18]|nr:MAG: DNA ligase (NAD(+)) LigA [Rhodothermaeota bacterium MED-G18]